MPQQAPSRSWHGWTALVVSGGPDVEPARYGAVREAECGPSSPERDAWELALIEAALARRTPLLGICRGMQLLNVVLGGTLVQHMEGHRGEPGVFGQHMVRPVAGTRLAQVLPDPVPVPTYHHQALARFGDGLVPGAYAEDGTVEAVELPRSEHPFALAVQWHPEEGEDVRVMRALVDAAREPSPRWWSWRRRGSSPRWRSWPGPVPPRLSGRAPPAAPQTAPRAPR